MSYGRFPFRPHAIPNPACPAFGKIVQYGTEGKVTHPADFSLAGERTFVRTCELAWDLARDAATGVLAKHGIRLGSAIGAGTYGKAFEIQGDTEYVVKLTGDATDAMAWSRVAVSGLRSKHLADTPCAFALPVDVPPSWPTPPGRAFFALVQERLRPINPAARAFLNDSRAASALLFLGGVDDRAFDNETEATAEIDSKIKQLAKAGKILPRPKVFEGVRAIQDLVSIGVEPFDIHGGNVMLSRTGIWKLTDLGQSSLHGVVDIPVVRP